MNEEFKILNEIKDKLPLIFQITDLKSFNNNFFQSKSIYNKVYNCSLVKVKKHFKSIVRI